MLLSALEAAEAFAESLDRGDWRAAEALLAPDCVYAFRGGSLAGPQAILASYRMIDAWAKRSFDSVRYESRVEAMGDGRARIHFRDLMDHAGHHLDFRCQQLVTTDEAGRIRHLEHVDLPGESEKADAFNRACVVVRPGA